MNNVHFSSEQHTWETPPELFRWIQRIIGHDFKLDAAASAQNALCESFYSDEHSGLDHDWKNYTWCNPPYGRQLSKWTNKASKEYYEAMIRSVLLLPARTDTKWFHNAMEYAESALLLEGRLKFGMNGQPGKQSAPFPSCLMFFGIALTREQESKLIQRGMILYGGQE